MSNPALSQPGQVVDPGVTPARPFLDAVFGEFWPEQSVPAAPRLVVAALVAGLVAAVVLPFRAPGIGTFLVLVVVAAVVAAADAAAPHAVPPGCRGPVPPAGLDGVRAGRGLDRDAVPAGRGRTWRSRPSPRAARSRAC